MGKSSQDQKGESKLIRGLTRTTSNRLRLMGVTDEVIITGTRDDPSFLSPALKEIEEMRADFDSIDVDGSGEISSEEMRKMMVEQMGSMGGAEPTQEDVDKLVGEYDLDGDRAISFEEYVLKLYNLQSVRV
eukprot:1493528-Pyramimonas_sp.AAC.1